MANSILKGDYAKTVLIVLHRSDDDSSESWLLTSVTKICSYYMLLLFTLY